jgi:hypothetical protein
VNLIHNSTEASYTPNFRSTFHRTRRQSEIVDVPVENPHDVSKLNVRGPTACETASAL